MWSFLTHDIKRPRSNANKAGMDIRVIFFIFSITLKKDIKNSKSKSLNHFARNNVYSINLNLSIKNLLFYESDWNSRIFLEGRNHLRERPSYNL